MIGLASSFLAVIDPNSFGLVDNISRSGLKIGYLAKQSATFSSRHCVIPITIPHGIEKFMKYEKKASKPELKLS